MPKGYWLSVIAIVGLASAALAQAEQSQRVPEDTPGVQEQHKGQAGTGQNDTGKFSIPVRIIEDPIEAQRARDSEEKTRKHETDDLQAQIRTADASERAAAAAERQIVIAWWQLAFAGLGTIAFLYTLKLARQANKHALSAVETAEAANAISEDTAKRQLRAYIEVRAVYPRELEDGKPVPVCIELANCGQTPARNIAAMGQVFTGEYPLGPGAPQAPDTLPEDPRGSVGPDLPVLLIYRTAQPYSSDFQEHLDSGKFGVWIHGVVRYEDIFGRRWHTRFNYVCGGRLAKDFLFFADATGNEST
jgi:hypothetical protein